MPYGINWLICLDGRSVFNFLEEDLGKYKFSLKITEYYGKLYLYKLVHFMEVHFSSWQYYNVQYRYYF